MSSKLPNNWFKKSDKSGGYVEVEFEFDTITLNDFYDSLVEVEDEIYNPEYSIDCDEDSTPTDLYHVITNIYDNEYSGELYEMMEKYGDNFEINNVGIVARGSIN